MEIQQALWGYSGGHHLLASSIPLSAQSIKILGPLTDLSGSDMPSSFDGYLTGCPLKAEKYYALSKTWYANEMRRPGCVWTHTLLFDYSLMFSNNVPEIESLFSRPNINENDWKSYIKPIIIDHNNESPSPNSTHMDEVTQKVLSLITNHAEPIIISASNVLPFNYAIESLLRLLGISFFFETSFCTGSFANRTINKNQLDLQIVPDSISKLVSRTSQKNTIYIDSAFAANNKKCIFEDDYVSIKRFILSCEPNFYQRAYWSVFSTVFKKIYNSDSFSLGEIISILKNKLSKEETSFIVKKIFDLMFSPVQDSIVKSSNSMIDILFEFLTIDFESFEITFSLSNNSLFEILDSLWKRSKKDILNLLPRLARSTLNVSGEEAFKYITALITTRDYSYLLQQDSNLCILILEFNWKFAICNDLWTQPQNVQLEAIQQLKKNSDAIRKNTICSEDILCLIFKTSCYDLTKEVYEAFQDLAINVFFDWCDNTICDEKKLKLWVSLCKYNQLLSIKKLQYVNRPNIFELVVDVLNPYDKTLRNVPPNTWELFYSKFCTENNLYSVKTTFAQFILPIILQSSHTFSTQITEFAFTTVHKILADDNMCYYEWDKLSKLLPDVAWYNSWDKCKRLRKAAKMRNYDIAF